MRIVEHCTNEPIELGLTKWSFNNNCDIVKRNVALLEHNCNDLTNKMLIKYDLKMAYRNSFSI